VILAAMLGLAISAPAGAAPTPATPSASVSIDSAAVSTAGGQASLLVPVRYPIQLGGRVVKTRIALLDSSGKTIQSWQLRRRLNGGRFRTPDRRRSFTFVHQVGLDPALVTKVREGSRVRVDARGDLDVDQDGHAELRSGDHALLTPTLGARKQPLCGTVPHLRVERGGQVSVPLPACDRAIEWAATGKGTRGRVRVRDDQLLYYAPKGFRGRDEIQLVPRRPGASALASGLGSDAGQVEVTVGAPSKFVVRAIGDSVTAGFGYYSSGKEIGLSNLLGCRPVSKNFNDACSSNSRNDKSEEGPPNYVGDYGLSNKISWAAQWASKYGVVNYKNFAISGSEPKNWAAGGEFHGLVEGLEGEGTEYVLLTLGANPLLSRVLFELDPLGCEIFESFRECVEKEFKAVGLRNYLNAVYKDLVEHTKAKIFVMQYHLAIPWSDVFYTSYQLAELETLLNNEIAIVAGQFSPQRLQVISPPPFHIGINVSPLLPSSYTCKTGGRAVDGASAQSEWAQKEFKHDPEVKEFCPGTPWIINHDTGIHPSALGYTQMASKVPAPG
jgi:hypothetical protein